MRNVRIRMAYDGSRFFGWQRQDGFESVQQSVEEALEALLGRTVVVHGAGRTDTGVHALGQVASFHVDTRLDDERLCHALNAHLPPSVRVECLETCAADFHARFSARAKRYAYVVRSEPFRPPFAHELYHWERPGLDVEAMRRAARAVLGRRDFSAFANAGSPRSSNVRHLTALHVLARRRALAIVTQGDGFLYRMVRTIAGTLIDVGRGRIDVAELEHIMTTGDRRLAGPTAPARGLYLLSVLYPEPCFVRRPAARSARAALFPSPA